MGFFGELIFDLLVMVPIDVALDRSLVTGEFKADLSATNDQSRIFKRVLAHYDPLRLAGMDECSALYAQLADAALASLPETGQITAATLYSVLKREGVRLSSDVRFTVNKSRLRKASKHIAELASRNSHV